jgi:hypothetical protein
MAQQGTQSTSARGRARPSDRRRRSRWQRDRQKRRRILIAGLVATLIILAIPVYGYTSTFVMPPRQWVVQVNDVSYNMGYLLKLLRMFQRGSQMGGAGINLGTMPFELVNTLAENELIRQGAPRYEITVSRQDVDAEIRDRFLSSTPGDQTSAEQLEQEFQETYRGYLNLVQISEREHRDIVTSELFRVKLREFLGRDVDRVQEQAHLFSIEIPPVDSALEIVDEVQTEFARGATFETLVERFSADPELYKGGEVGWVPRGIFEDLDVLFFDELAVGELSEPIPKFNAGAGGTGFTIYLVKERAEAREVEKRHLDTLKTRSIQAWLTEERKPENNEVRIDFGSVRYEWLINQLRLSAARQ